MSEQRLTYHARPTMRRPSIVMGLDGWMDGGNVSTGTIETFIAKLEAEVLAEMDAEDCYILSFPGSMEVSSLLRPHVNIADGLITEYGGPTNTFYFSRAEDLILMVGKEPHLRWREYGQALFSLASDFAVGRIYFIGSVAGLVPHTREPRLYSSVSDEALREELAPFGVRFSNYKGPASVVTYLMHEAPRHGIPMATLVAEVPAYVEGRNPRCIGAVARNLAGILGLRVNVDDLRLLGDELEERLSEMIREHPELQERIGKLEQDYDNEVFDMQMGDLKTWLQQRGIRPD
ncbi:MAG TPA: PAC2 family protein [Phycisphaerae bacterium]|nr:PAC2 family protein [Phycisphaerae bacterium]